MNDKELKPCPFCGSKSVWVADNILDDLFIGYNVHCNGCGAETRYTKDRDKAIERWNRRATMNNEFKVDDVSEQSFRSGYTQGKSEDSRIYQISNHYGYAVQSDKIIEECAELTQAIMKLRWGWSDDKLDHVQEELADVLIMARQLRVMLGANDIDEIINQKLDRQIERIAEEDKK